MEKEKVEFIPFHLILTKQEIVRKKRLETFKRFISDGHGPKISPVTLYELDIEGFEGYELVDGNHRCRAFLEMNDVGINAIVKPRENTTIKGTLRPIKDLRIVDLENEIDIKAEEWLSRKYKGRKHYGDLWEE